MESVASCCCGQLSISFPGEVTKSSICHCYACQKRTGSAFGVQTRIPKADTQVVGTSTRYRRIPEDGGWVDHHFCPICGTTLFWLIDDQDDPNNAMAGFYIVAIGGLAGQKTPSPTFSVYEAHMHEWVQLPNTITTRWE